MKRNFLLPFTCLLSLLLCSCSKSPEFAPELHNDMLWAWNMSAVLNYRNKADPFIYGGVHKQNADEQEYRDLLSKWWEIENSEQALETINQLIEGRMHHPRFVRDYSPLFEVPKEELVQRVYKDPFVNEVIKSIDQCKEVGIIAWDLSRGQSVVAWSYLAGYIPADFAASASIHTAIRTRIRFESWQDYANNYLLGFYYWSRDAKAYQERRDIVDYLLVYENSPWVKVPWDSLSR